MLWRIPADLHEQRIGVMGPTQAFFGCPGPATSVSATRVFPPRLSRWRGTSGVAEIAENKFYVATGSSGTARVGSCRRHSGAIAKRQGVFHAHPKAKHCSGLPRPALQGKKSGHMQPDVLAVGWLPGLTSRPGGPPVPIQYTPLANSTYLDYDSYRSDAALPTGAGPAGNFTFNVALVLDRANDPTALLNSDWASRQQQLETLTDSGTLWS